MDWTRVGGVCMGERAWGGAVSVTFAEIEVRDLTELWERKGKLKWSSERQSAASTFSNTY